LRKRPSSASSAGPRSSALLFAALGDPTRLWLITRLSGGGLMSITALTAGARVTRQAISKHLRVLEGAGIVRGRRRGRESVWQLERRSLQEARRYLTLISSQWDIALGRLRELVEK